MKRTALVLALAAASSACAVGPKYERPPLNLPPKYAGAEESAAEARTLASVPWWDVFNDPVLKQLIEQALAQGFDARLAAARVAEARALYGVSRADLFPSVGYSGSVRREHVDQVANAAQPVRTVYTANVGFSWELDLWGRIRRQNEAALANYFASEDARRGVAVSLIADVATAYFDLRELDAELAIARRTTVAFEDTYRLFDRRLTGGAASALETARAEAALGEVAAQIPEIERAIAARENQISFLLGQPPHPIERDTAATERPPDIPPGLPAELLERRPDIRESEQALRSANALVGEAKARYFPTLSLTGFFGNVSKELGDLFSSGKAWNLEPSLTGPIFTGGALRRNHAAAVARYEQSRVLYERAVTNALVEVSTALVDRTRLVETEEQRTRTVRAFTEAVRLANLRYTSGLSAYFEVLDAQQQLFPAEINLARTRRDQLLAVVNLYRALGGGWQSESGAEAAAAQQQQPQQ